jgi:hypothetical protein
MTRDDERNLDGCDRNDAFARGDEDPPTRGRSLKALEQETELEFQRLEARNTGGAEHQSRDERPVERELKYHRLLRARFRGAPLDDEGIARLKAERRPCSSSTATSSAATSSPGGVDPVP